VERDSIVFSRLTEACSYVKIDPICNDRELYRAVNEYMGNVWKWGGDLDGDFGAEPSPDDLITLLESRIAWVKAHQQAVEHYLNRRCGPHWVRVIDGSKGTVKDRSNG
jgi:hypothetical protein